MTLKKTLIPGIHRLSRYWNNDHLPQDTDAEPSSPAEHDPAAEAPAPRAATEFLAGHRRTLNYPSTTLGRLLDQTADRFADAPALAFTDVRWNYAQLLEQVNRMAGGLASMGVHRGETVMITLPNCPEYVVAFLAAQKIGAVVVNAGPIRGTDDLKQLLRTTLPKVVVALDLQAPQLAAANESRNRHCWLWVSLKAYQGVLERMGYRWKLWQHHATLAQQRCQATWQQLMDAAPPRPPTVCPDPDDLAVLQPSSGTTAAMKIAELSHRNLIANATQIAAWLNLQPGQERIVGLLPMFHVYGLQTTLIGPVFGGALMLPMTRFRVGDLLEIIREHQPTVVPLVPAVMAALCDVLEQDDDAEVRRVLRQALVSSGAAPLDPPTARRFSELTGATLVEGYGLTEASPVTHINPPDDPHPGTIGLTLADTRMRLADLDDPHRDAEPGQPGELYVSGPQVFHGYFDAPDLTEQALHTDEEGTRWLHTGDVAVRDDAGFTRIVDRRQDLINCGGFKVYPAKVEQVLCQHPRVKEAAVFARAHDVHTEQVVAAIVPAAATTDGHVAELEEELRALCREHLSPYEVPKVFEWVTELPRSPLGKLLKRELRAKGSNNNGSNHHGDN